MRTFTYDSENRLLTGTAPTAVTLTYDPTGRLQTSTASSATTTYLYAGSMLAAEYNGSTVLRRYVPGPDVDEPLVWYEGSGTTSRRWLPTDDLGSVIGYSDASGNSDAIYGYGASGEPSSAWSGSRYSYTGQIMTPEANLYYYKARAYDPVMGRFLQTDPSGYSSGTNLYAYATNDPANIVDPTGMAGSVTGIGAGWYTYSGGGGADIYCNAGGSDSTGSYLDYNKENDPDIFLNAASADCYQASSGGDESGFAGDAGSITSAPQGAQGTTLVAQVTVTASKNTGLTCSAVRMLVTSYNDHGAGSDWAYWKNNPGGVGPGTVAVADTTPPPYPYGTRFNVLNSNGSSAYSGTALDTGAGWDASHQNVDPSQWIDIWLPGSQATQWGVQWRNVEVCTVP